MRSQAASKWGLSPIFAKIFRDGLDEPPTKLEVSAHLKYWQMLQSGRILALLDIKRRVSHDAVA